MKNQKKRQKDLNELKQKAPHTPVIILVRPQMAENIGMTARAMMNCGLYDLRVVAPREMPTDEKAYSASSGADSILKNAKVYNTLMEAVGDLQYVLATTARARHLSKPVLYASDIGKFLSQTNCDCSHIGILFGCERTGLENSELEAANMLLTVPLNPEHTSLNLSQAVLLVCYECQKALRSKLSLASAQITEPNPQATKQEIALLLEKLNLLLEERGYYSIADKRPKMQQNLDNIFQKASLTSQEVRTMHGVLNTLASTAKKS